MEKLVRGPAARRVRRATFLLVISLGLTSCASQWALSRARRQLDQGDPVGAVLSAAQAVRHDPKNADAVALLLDIFPAAIERRRADADAATASDRPFKWEDVAAALSDIHAMNDAVGLLPDLRPDEKSPPVVLERTNYYAELEAVRQQAAADRYEAGLAATALGTKPDWREAAGHFSRALAFIANYRDAVAREAEARELGSDHIYLPLFDTYSAHPAAAGFAAMLNDALAGQLVAAASRREFVQVVERSRVEELLRERELSAAAIGDLRIKPETYGFYGADLVVFGNVSSLLFTDPIVKTTDLPFTAEVNEVVAGAALVNGVVPTRKVTVNAVVTVVAKRSAATASAGYRVVRTDTGVVLDSFNRSAAVEDSYEWALISGDPRAVPPHYQALAMKQDKQVRLPQQMLPELTEALTEGVAAAILAKVK